MYANIINSFLVAILFSAASSAMARINGQIDRSVFDGNFDRRLSAKGIVFCLNDDHENSGNCDLRFRDSVSGETVSIRNESLQKIHCDGHVDLKATLSGTYYVRGIFGDYAKINRFDISGELPKNTQIRDERNGVANDFRDVGKNI